MYVKDRSVDAAAPPPHTHHPPSRLHTTEPVVWPRGEEVAGDDVLTSIYVRKTDFFFFFSPYGVKNSTFAFLCFLFLPICTRGACIAVLTLWGVGWGGGLVREVGWAGSFTFSPCPSDHFLLFFFFCLSTSTNKKKKYQQKTYICINF